MSLVSSLASSDSSQDPGKTTCFDSCLAGCIAVATLATACFVTLAILHESTVASALSASMTGACGLICMATLACKKCVSEDKKSQTPEEATPQSATKPAAAQPKRAPLPRPKVTRPPNPLVKEEWLQRLEMDNQNPHLHCSTYNLIDPASSVASNPSNHQSKEVPMLGDYTRQFSDMVYRPELAVRLPLSQLPAYPQEIQDLFQADPDVELYFLIYDDSRSKSTHRNLVFHYMAIPEYQKEKDQQHPVAGLTRTKLGGLACSIEAGLYEAQGIAKSPETEDTLAQNRMKPFRAHFHPDEDSKDVTAISPDHCIVNLTPGVPFASFYGAARFRNRSIAFYTLLIKDLHSPEGVLIQKATRQPNLLKTLEVLSSDHSPCAADVQKLFAYYI